MHKTPFSNFVRMHIHSLVPRPKYTAIGLGARLVHSQVKSRVDQHWQQAVRTGGMVFSRDSGMNTMYVGKVLHSAG